MDSPTSAEEPQGYLLLTLNDVKVERLYEGQRMPIASGELRLECISLPIDPSIGHQRANPFADSTDPTVDLWLVLQVGTYETTLLPTLQMSVGVSASGGRELTIPSDSTVLPPSSGTVNGVVLTLPKGSTEDEQEDIQTFEVLLRQYGCLTSEQVPEVKEQAAVASSSSKNLTGLANIAEDGTAATAGSASAASLAPPTLPARPGLNRAPSTQGRLVLVDTKSGEVVGELSEQLPMQEEQALLDGGADNKSPVIVDFGEIEYSGVVKHVQVRTVDPEDMDDWILKGAHYISKGILSISGASQSAINSAAEFYISHTDKYVEPTKFSPATKSSIRQVHNVSAKGYKVTKKTLGMVNEAITKYAGPVIDNSFEGAYHFKEAVKADLPESITKRRVSLDMFRSEEEKKKAAESPAKPKKPFISRLIQAGEVVLTSIEAAGQGLINTSTDAGANVAGHKFGPEAAQATQLLGGSVRNVALVYVDVRGVGRQALLKSAGQGFVKTTLKSGNKVRLMAHEAKNGQAAQMTMSDGEVVDTVIKVTSDESPVVAAPTAGAPGSTSEYPQEKAVFKKAE